MVTTSYEFQNLMVGKWPIGVEADAEPAITSIEPSAIKSAATAASHRLTLLPRVCIRTALS